MPKSKLLERYSHVHFDLARVFFWLAITPASYLLGWLNSVVFVSLVSIWALVETAWAAYRGGQDKHITDRLDRIEEALNEILGGRRF